jgi:hypothetical protein
LDELGLFVAALCFKLPLANSVECHEFDHGSEEITPRIAGFTVSFANQGKGAQDSASRGDSAWRCDFKPT